MTHYNVAQMKKVTSKAVVIALSLSMLLFSIFGSIPTQLVHASNPDLTVTQTSEDAYIASDNTFSYDIMVTNNGNTPATDVIITEQVDDSAISIVSADPQTQSATETRWNISRLESGKTTRIHVKAQRKDEIKKDFEVVRKETVQSNEHKPETKIIKTKVRCKPQYELLKSVDKQTAAPGDELTYTLRYQNIGAQTTKTIALVDKLPEYTTFVSTTSSGEISANSVIWNITELSDTWNEVIFTVKINENVPSETEIVNSFSLFADNIEVAESNIVRTTIIVPEIPGAPILHISKTADTETAVAGGNLTYAISYSNSGTADAENVVINEVYDPNTAFVSAEPKADEKSINTWSIGALPAGQEGTIKVTVKVASPLEDGTLLTNTATITADGLREWATLTTRVVSTMDLAITKTVDKINAEPGDLLTYTITYKNLGTTTAHNVAITDTYDENTAFVSSSNKTHNSAGTQWTIGDLAPRQSGSFTLLAKVRGALAGGITDITNTASIEAKEKDINNKNNISSVTTQVRSTAALSIEKANSSGSFVNPGETVTFVITLHNLGTSASLNTQIVDKLPEGFSFIPNSSRLDTKIFSDPTGSNPYVWNIGSMLPAQSITLTYQAKLSAGIAAGVYNNSAFAQGTLDDGSEIKSPQDSSAVTVKEGQVLPASTVSPTPTLPKTGTNGLMESIAIVGMFFSAGILLRRNVRTLPGIHSPVKSIGIVPAIPHSPHMFVVYDRSLVSASHN